MKKILITTTFREFKEGNKNSDMQEDFLRSLLAQTYQNFVVVVTLFGEKNVEKVVCKYLNDKAFFVEKEIPGKFRYSPTEVICSGIEINSELGADVILDCSGDIKLENNFLECVERNVKTGYMGVSAPNVFVDENGNTKKKSGNYPGGIDVRFFDAKLFVSNDVYLKLKNYPLFDWGGIEHFVTAIGVKYAHEMINIFEDSKVIKKDNDRVAENEIDNYMKIGVARNHRRLRRLAMRIGIEPDDIVDMNWVYSQYKKVERGTMEGTDTNFCIDQVDSDPMNEVLSKEKNIEAKKAIDKYWMLFSMMKDWCQLFQKKKNVKEYFIKNGLNNIAIYGLGDVGEVLYNELKGTDINIVCGIDQSSFYLIDDIDVITPNDAMPSNLDAIIVTPVNSYEGISSCLKNKTDAQIISLEDIICTLLNE